MTRRICDGGEIPVERMFELVAEYKLYCERFENLLGNDEEGTPQKFEEWCRFWPVEKGADDKFLAVWKEGVANIDSDTYLSAKSFLALLSDWESYIAGPVPISRKQETFKEWLFKQPWKLEVSKPFMDLTFGAVGKGKSFVASAAEQKVAVEIPTVPPPCKGWVLTSEYVGSPKLGCFQDTLLGVPRDFKNNWTPVYHSYATLIASWNDWASRSGGKSSMTFPRWFLEVYLKSEKRPWATGDLVAKESEGHEARVEACRTHLDTLRALTTDILNAGEAMYKEICDLKSEKNLFGKKAK